MEPGPTRAIVRAVVWLAVMLVAFFIVSAVLMVSWNYAIPRLAESVGPYKTETFSNITFTTAMVVTILMGALFRPGWGMHLFDELEKMI